MNSNEKIVNPVDPILSGKYLQDDRHRNPPAELSVAIGMPIPPALAIVEAEK